MQISAVDKEFMQYFTRLDEPQKKSLLEMLKTFSGIAKADSGLQTLEEYNQEINEAMARIDNGTYTTIEELEREMQEW
jgi:hypothetical protein